MDQRISRKIIVNGLAVKAELSRTSARAILATSKQSGYERKEEEVAEAEDTKGETEDEDRRRGGEQRIGTTRKRIRRRRGNSCSTEEATSDPVLGTRWKKKLGSGGIARAGKGVAYKERRVTKIEP